MTGALTIHPLLGMPEVVEGDDLAQMIFDAAHRGPGLEEHDVVVITQKIVSKAEGRVAEVPPGDQEARWNVAEQEAVRILRRRRGLLIAETRHGFVCANAGVDASNIEEGKVVLLPLDPDKSARRIRKRIQRLAEVEVAVIISDTFGRAWRTGQTNVAIGVAGMHPLLDFKGTKDHLGRELKATAIAVADEIAGAAELVMGKADMVPVAVVRGFRYVSGRGRASSLVRRAQDDLFR